MYKTESFTQAVAQLIDKRKDWLEFYSKISQHAL